MFNFMVTNEGGLTTAGYAIAIIAGIILFLAAICFPAKQIAARNRMIPGCNLFCRKTLRKTQTDYKTACILCCSYGTRFYHFLPEDYYSAVGRKRYSLQYAVDCTGC